MPHQNRVDPWGDLHAVSARGMFTGNRGCLVDDGHRVVRHHRGSLWITCMTRYKNWSHGLDEPNVWTPLFFLDDAVALAAGHRPCRMCRRSAYVSYQEAATIGTDAASLLSAIDLNRMLAAERLRRGRGLARAQDRVLVEAELASLPPGTVVLDPFSHTPHLVTTDRLQPFTFGGWGSPIEISRRGTVKTLTPPTSVTALRHGFVPQLHETAIGARTTR